jgi:hypothetical protein
MRTSARRIKVLLLGAFAALAMSRAPLLRADAAAAAPEPKDHTLFMGLNLQIQEGDQFYNILGVSGSAAVIKVNGAVRLVPFLKIEQYQIKKVLKVGRTQASLDHIQGDRAYTPYSDPRRIWHNRETQLTGYADDVFASLTGTAGTDSLFTSGRLAGNLAAQEQAENATANAIITGAANNGTMAGRMPGLAGGGLYAGGGALSADTANDGFYNQKMQEDLDKRLFDAIEVTFEVSSPQELEAPYAVILAEFRESEKAAETARWIYIKPLQSIDAQPTRVHVLQGGFPPGFALGRIEVHLYDRAREIPTSASARKVALTRSDVIKFAAIQYLHEHRGQTLRPTPMHDSAPSSLREEIDPAQLREKFEVEINPEGEVVRVSATSGSGPVPQRALELWRKLRFYPALEKGTPVAATVKARLADFLE